LCSIFKSKTQIVYCRTQTNSREANKEQFFLAIHVVVFLSIGASTVRFSYMRYLNSTRRQGWPNGKVLLMKNVGPSPSHGPTHQGRINSANKWFVVASGGQG
jgi:hypothetical protein